MDFNTTAEVPISVTINGTAYQIPLLRNTGLKKMSAMLRKQVLDEATSHIEDPDKRAQFKAYFPVPAYDIADLMLRATTPELADVAVDTQLEAAGVPPDVRKAFIDNVHPDRIRDLAAALTRRNETLARLGVDEAKEKSDPLPPSTGGSVAPPETATPIEPASTASTAA